MCVSRTIVASSAMVSLLSLWIFSRWLEYGIFYAFCLLVSCLSREESSGEGGFEMDGDLPRSE